ncbi:MAG TPA: AMP-binding protein [Gemmataceae bacterium]|nr:AMP-binding protein [Gemmataceae bacterium]
MNLAHVLASEAHSRPKAPAIIDRCKRRERITTFADLERRSHRIARLFVENGLKPGDAVLVFYPMSAELYVCLLAIFRLGLVAMFLDPSAGREHIEHCCALHRPKGFVGGTKAHLLRLFSRALRQIPVKIVIGFPLPGTVRWSSADALFPWEDIRETSDDAPALLTFTSGSTGLPKAAVRTHGFLMAQHRALAESLRLTRGDRDLATLPIVALANLGSGVTTIIPDADLRFPGAVDPGPILGQMREHQVISSVASPAFFERLARHCHEHGIVLPKVKKLYTGGAPVFPRLLDQIQTMAPNAEVVALYGSTEAEPIAHVGRDEIAGVDLQAMLAGKGLLAGVPVDCIRLRILRDQWGRPVGPFTQAAFEGQCCRPGEAGEIVVSGGHVLTGYLHGRGDEETKFAVECFVWHRTGDAGYLDDSGRLWLLGRCVARIHDDRGELYPFAAETAVYQDPRIKRAAVVAHEGRRVLAVEFYDGRRGDLDALRESLTWTRLDEVRVLKQVPVDKRHNAKVDYPALHRLLER